MNELIKKEVVTAATVYGEKGGADAIIEKVEKAARQIVPNIKTEAGRSEIKTLAANVAKSKVYLDDMGKDLNAERKRKTDLVNADRKKIRDRFDDLKKEVRQPLTDYENKEKDRVFYIDACIENIDDYQYLNVSELTFEELEKELNNLKAMEINDSFEEFKGEAAIKKDNAVRVLGFTVAQAKIIAEEKAELEKLRLEKETREKVEYEDKLKKEAAEKATREAEEKAEKERKRVEAEKAEAERQANEKERLAQEAIEKAQAEKREAELKAELSAKHERERIEKEERGKIAAEEARAADKKHKKAIMNDIINFIVDDCKVARKTANVIVEAMHENDMPHVKILY